MLLGITSKMYSTLTGFEEEACKGPGAGLIVCTKSGVITTDCGFQKASQVGRNVVMILD